MRVDGWQRARVVFEQLLDEPRHVRAARARERCGADEALCREVLELLDADGETRGFLEEGALAACAREFEIAAAEPSTARRIGPFEVIETLGQGGTAIVYRAREAGGEERADVAVKVIKPGLETDEVLGRFRLERQVLAGLTHPGIVAALDAGVTDAGRPYLVLEYVDGTPLDRYVIERELPLGERLRLFLDVCEAVHHAHQRLVVHRDLKPSNILVTAEGRVVVLDFGVAKLLGSSSGAGWTRAGARGPLTLSHASPEQIRGEAVTTATDVYSLGVVLYELLAGKPPYTAENGQAVLAAEPAPPSARTKRPVAPDLDTIVLCALRKDPAERYASVRHLAEDLRRHLAHEPILARGELWGQRARKALRRHRVPVAAGSGVVLLLLAGWITAQVSLGRVRRSEGIAWRAHADAVYVTSRLAEVLERIAAGEVVGEPGVLALLKETEHRIDTDLSHSPEAEARLRYVLGRVYMRLGRRGEARVHIEKALALSRTTRGLSRLDVERNEALLRELSE